MLYLGGDKGWVRKELIATAEGDPVPPPGARGQGRGAARSERAAAQEQRHHRRRAPLDRRARQAGVRHQGRLRGEADQRLPRESAEGHGAAVILQSAGLQEVRIAGREGRRSFRLPFLPSCQSRLPAMSHLLILGGTPDDRRRAARRARSRHTHRSDARRGNAAVRARRRDLDCRRLRASSSSTRSSARFPTRRPAARGSC